MQKYISKFKKIFGFLMIAVLLLGFPLESFAYSGYKSSSELVVVGPYDTPVSSGTSWGVSSSSQTRDFLAVGQKYRIRQNGTVSRVYLYVRDLDGLTGVYVKIWRKSDSTYDLVGSSNNIVTSLKANSFNTVDLNNPILGVQEGDYIGFRIEGNQHNFYARSGVSGVVTYCLNNATPANTEYAWESQTAYSGYVVPISVYMQAPQVVFIGDSIIAGHPNHYSFLEDTATTNIESTIEKQFSNLTGYTYQNMGIGGKKTSEIATRFKSDVIDLKPQLVIMDGGINDINIGDVSKETFLSNWKSMLDTAQADSNIKTVVILKMTPWTNASNLQMSKRDNWNTSLATLASGYSKVMVVDVSLFAGIFRIGGATGNLWDIKPWYSADGVHFNQAGHTAIAKTIAYKLSLLGY